MLEGSSFEGSQFELFPLFFRNNMDKQFKAMDTQGKGTLSIDEAWKVANEYECLLSRAEVEAAFTLADRDGDGIITYKKFIQVLTI